MTEVGAGAAIYGLRKRIRDIESELGALGAFEPSQELIESANLLRSNEYLSKKTQKQAELAEAYVEYSGALEEMLSAVFEIQNDLKDVLKEQSSLLSGTRPKRRPKKSDGKGAAALRRGRRRRP